MKNTAGRLRNLAFQTAPQTEVVFRLPDGREFVIDTAAAERAKTAERPGQTRPAPRLVFNLTEAPAPAPVSA